MPIQIRRIFMGYYTNNTGKRLCFSGINFLNNGVGMGASQYLPIHHTGK
ncbi:hypothetical protein ES703_87939 [subsurface metagenome]